MDRERQKLLIAFTITSVTFMELLDATILNTALPKIAQTMHVDVLDAKASITSYLVSLGILIPVSGWIADRFGMKRTILAAVMIFTLSSALCGMAKTLPMLLFFRILQGLGGALMTPVARLILVRMFHKDDLVRIAGLVAIPVVFGPLLGPLIGGYITTEYSWSWIFYVNVPIGIAAMTLMWFLLEDDTERDGRPFDLRGFALSGVGLTALTVALESMDNASVPREEIGLAFALGAIFILLTVLHCRKREGAVFDLSLFEDSPFRTGFVQTTIQLIGTAGIPFLLAVMLQSQFGMTPLECGMLLFAAPFGSILMKPMVTPLVRAVGYRTIMFLYPVAVAAGVASLVLIDDQTPRFEIAALLFLYGLTLSVQMNMLNSIPYIGIPGAKSSKATSLQSTNLQFSMSLGISAAALLLDSFLDWQGLQLGSKENMRETVRVFHTSFVVLAFITLTGAIAARGFRVETAGKEEMQAKTAL